MLGLRGDRDAASHALNSEVFFPLGGRARRNRV
jgi:hypothetical protein